MPTCQYKYESNIPKEINFACNEPSIPNSIYCIFHDKEHYLEYEQEAIKRFEEKVLESISQNKPLECFGYYLPAINFAKLLKEKTFVQPVYFNEATFHKVADFAGLTFSKAAYFDRATFSEGAYFGLTTFSGEADFAGATFPKEQTFVTLNSLKEQTLQELIPT